MLKALYNAESVTVACPHCQAAVGTPGDGSHIWTTADFDYIYAQGHHKIGCDDCGKTFSLPMPKTVRFS